MEDLRILTCPKSADRTIWTIHIFVMAAFFLEIVLRSYAQRGFLAALFLCSTRSPPSRLSSTSSDLHTDEQDASAGGAAGAFARPSPRASARA